MSYATIAVSANDFALQQRLTAAIADEGHANPTSLLGSVLWPVCSANDIEAAYASALAAGNPNPGGDESVITDGMILSALQANLPAP